MLSLFPTRTARQRLSRALTRTLLPAAAALALIVAPTASAQAVYCEQNGLIVAQAETAGPAAGWNVENALPGYTGSSYLRWTGGNQFANPGQGILTYTLNVTTPGTYQLRIRNLHNHPDPGEENDCWARMDGGGWIKVFSPATTTDWNWASWFEPGLVLTSYFLSAGTHTFQISGRSNNFRIDRLHFFLDGTPNPQGLFHPESTCVNPWTNLGQGKSGTAGLTPTLAGSGTLTPSSNLLLGLGQARPNSVASLFVGLTQINAPFKGGVLVPNVNFHIAGLPTGPSGSLVLNTTWPAGFPSGTSIYWQYWIADPVASYGLSASNGLRGTTP